MAGLSLVSLLLTLSCNSGTAPLASIQVVTPETQAPAQQPVSTVQPPVLGTQAAAKEPITSILQLTQGGKGIKAMENGDEVSLGDGVGMEVYLVPYPPVVDSALHLFLAKGATYKPVKAAAVHMVYINEDMDCGETPEQNGKELAVGQYMVPLYFPMYGNYLVNVTVSWLNEQQQLEQQNVQLRVRFLTQELPK